MAGRGGTERHSAGSHQPSKIWDTRSWLTVARWACSAWRDRRGSRAFSSQRSPGANRECNGHCETVRGSGGDHQQLCANADVLTVQVSEALLVSAEEVTSLMPARYGMKSNSSPLSSSCIKYQAFSMSGSRKRRRMDAEDDLEREGRAQGQSSLPRSHPP